jgi:hypothetical protein
MRILVKYPTKWRWKIFEQNFSKYIGYCHSPSDTTFVVTVDEDDPWPKEWPVPPGVAVTVTSPLGKVAAINHGIPGDGWDVLVVASDDMVPRYHWDKTIREDVARNPQAWAINYNDDARLGDMWMDLITLPVLTRDGYNRFGWVYNPVYRSECCDCEQTQVLKSLGKVVDINDDPIRHEWSRVQIDGLAYINMAEGRADKAIYERRKALGFP